MSPRVRTTAWLLAGLLAFSLSDSADAAKARKKKRAKKPVAAPTFDTHLPVLGTRLAEFPAGPGKATADQACLSCHAADMVAQQKLTEKQWTASVTKMVGWGAPVPEDKRAELIEYLVKNFGPDNDRYQPVVTRPVGR